MWAYNKCSYHPRYLQRYKTTQNEGKHCERKQNDEILRCDSSFPLDQIVKLFHTDKNIHQYNECDKVFLRANYVFRHERLILERNTLNILYVVKLLHITVILKGMKEFILERKPMKTFNMVKPLHTIIVSKCIKELILERNSMNVINLVNLLPFTVVSKFINTS